MNDSEKIILEKIKNLRNQKGYSQSKLAKQIGISQTGYAKIERGETENLPLSVAVGIAKALDVGFNGLFNIDGDSNKINNLINIIEEQKQKIEELKEQIRFLKNEKEHIKAFLVNHMVIECNVFKDLINNEFLSSNSDDDKYRRSELIKNYDRFFEFNKYHYINTGFLSESDFENYYNELKGKYNFMYDDETQTTQIS